MFPSGEKTPAQIKQTQLNKNESKQANKKLDATEKSMNIEKPFENRHQNGAIHKIRLEHFLFHSNLTLCPGKNLNIFCGSSVIYGITIGMGGNPKILSKTDELHQYIQIGKETATITITLYNNNGYNSFCREFDRKNESKFKINEEDVSEEEYLGELHNLNIHVDNLCQFLPQLLLRDCISQYPQGLFEYTQKTMNQYNQQVKNSHNECYQRIKEINRKFDSLMKAMGYVGEVKLIHENERDYKNYGIEIRAKFNKKDRLHAVDTLFVSGGQQSLSIAVYCLSLQRLAQVPFHCVDVINEGLDLDNRTRLINMLVQTVAQPCQSQFFYAIQFDEDLNNVEFNEHVEFLRIE